MELRRGVLNGALRIIDSAIVLAAFGVAFGIPYLQAGGRMSVSEFLHARIEVWHVAVFIGWIAVWQICFEYFGLYRSRRLSPASSEWWDITKAVFTGSALFAVSDAAFGMGLLGSGFYVAFFAAAVLLSILARTTGRGVLYVARLSGRNLRHVVIAGTNDRAFEFARRILAKPELGYDLLGFVDESVRPIPHEFASRGYRVVADLDGFEAYLRAKVVDEVVVCLPVKSQYVQAERIISECREQGTMVRFLSDIFDNPQRKPSYLDHVDGDPVVTVYAGPRPGIATVIKRAIDVVVSAAFLLALAPVAAAIIVAIRVSSPGPAHFVQERMGRNKRRFHMYKFRTMVLGAEAQREALQDLNEVAGPVFKIKHDPRVTAVGRFLRKTSLDELPQFWNVLKGDMSLVGPRPLPVRDFEGFDEDWHRRRFSVRPGLTCLWQVEGRSNLSFDRWMELDMEYIDTWSLELDFRILVQTIPAVLRGSGAS